MITGLGRLHGLAVVLAVAFAAPAAGLNHACFIKAASSADGRTLVVSDVQLEPVKGQPQEHAITQITFQVYPETNPGNYGFTAPMKRWEDFVQWKVGLSSEIRELRLGCLIPMIPSGGDYLVLLNNTYGVDPQNTVMLIYKAPSRTEPNRELWGKGVLVKQLTLRDIWPGHQFSDVMITEGTPAWFEGNSFEWGKDNHSLVDKTHLGMTIRIDLDTGMVVKEPE